MSSTRQLAAILFTDIAGYTAMMQRDEQLTITMVKHHRAVLEKTVAEFDGDVIEFYGDGSLCIFTSSTETVHCDSIPGTTLMYYFLKDQYDSVLFYGSMFPYSLLKNIAFIKTQRTEQAKKLLTHLKMFHLTIMHFKQVFFMPGWIKRKKPLKN